MYGFGQVMNDMGTGGNDLNEIEIAFISSHNVCNNLITQRRCRRRGRGVYCQKEPLKLNLRAANVFGEGFGVCLF